MRCWSVNSRTSTIANYTQENEKLAGFGQVSDLKGLTRFRTPERVASPILSILPLLFASAGVLGRPRRFPTKRLETAPIAVQRPGGSIEIWVYHDGMASDTSTRPPSPPAARSEPATIEQPTSAVISAVDASGAARPLHSALPTAPHLQSRWRPARVRPPRRPLPRSKATFHVPWASRLTWTARGTHRRALRTYPGRYLRTPL